MSSISIKMKSIEVKSETRALRASWTAEMANDLKIYTGINPDDLALQIFKEQRKLHRKRKINKIFIQ